MSSLITDDGRLVFESSERVEIISTFDQLGLKDDLLRGIYTYGLETPSAIQQRALLPIASGRDVIVQAGTGMGKTSTCVIAFLQNIDQNLREPQVLILSPTRELASANRSVIVALGNHLDIQCHFCIGGVSVAEDIRKFDSGVHIVSGTPGRVCDIIRRKKLPTQNVKMLVLDKVDEILDMGLGEHVCDLYHYLPPATQVVFLGTTLPESVLQMASKLMKDPIRMLFERAESPLDRIKHYFLAVDKEEWKFDTLFDLFDMSMIIRAVIFCNTKGKVDWLAEKLRDSKFTVPSMHDDMPQEERDQIAADFRAGACRVLITTDDQTHDIDMTQVPQIINYDFPNHHEEYNDRMGSFGHPGRKTVAVNFVTAEDVKMFRDVEKNCRIQIDELSADAAELIT
ncbi:RNA helicase [Tulasnella sp. UAMH 9824]|nr:RNA helicase [Tulasnella sp. UAMH 9824]